MKNLKKLDLDNVMMDFDATSLYSSAIWDKNSILAKIKSGYAFKPHMKYIFVNDFNKKTFNPDGKDSAILNIKYFNPPHLIFQHLPVKEKVGKIEVNRMRIGYVIDILTGVDT